MGLYRFLKKRDQMAVRLSNLKYTPKPCKQIEYSGQWVQIDVKYVPQSCLVDAAVETMSENGGYYVSSRVQTLPMFRGI